MKRSIKKKSKPCPCGSGKAYTECCNPYHEGLAAPTAETLMRSRYSAYVLMLEQYLLDTWHPDSRPDDLNLAEDNAIKWLGLEIKRFEVAFTNKATVEFVARYKIDGNKAERLHEVSQFVFSDRWYYLSGVTS